ncbi:hypothetical protein BTO28_11405 [Domibacillus epiphyticus]|uniref:ATP-grasp domain-containing protein n=2 Tax=Domibacillus epiphyticus TaxID=1714355 RepID=A0A1V2A6Z4_9BACI|nr:hypothetical protein BTO28_11405 [Domibacillus epiphyticus]
MGERALPYASYVEQRGMAIRPSQSVQDIYGKDFVYNPKLYARDYQHFADDWLSLEALTGRELSVLGNMPIVCHEAAVTEAALDLFQKAGLQVPSVRYTYRNDLEYIQLLHKLRKQNKKIIFQYPHPVEEVPSDQYWVEPDVLAYVSDKRNIPELVPPENVPDRKMMSLDQILKEKPALPIILKTGDGRPTSGGCGVLLIEKEEQLYEIGESFGDLSNIIVEEYIPYDQNFGFHYVADKTGEIRFLGKSEQIINEDSCFRGSWISKDEDNMSHIIEAGYRVMKKIAEKGYVGMAGFDVLIRGDRFYFIDLNIRFNASTSGLMLYDDLQKKEGKEIVRLCNLEWQDDFQDLVPILEKYVMDRQFVPLSVLDAGYFEGENRASKVIGLVTGHSREEVTGVLDEMDRDGLCHRE